MERFGRRKKLPMNSTLSPKCLIAKRSKRMLEGLLETLDELAQDLFKFQLLIQKCTTTEMETIEMSLKNMQLNDGKDQNLEVKGVNLQVGVDQIESLLNELRMAKKEEPSNS